MIPGPAIDPAEDQLRRWPEWFPPMVVKELTQGLRMGGFVWPYCLLHLSTAGLLIAKYFFSAVLFQWLQDVLGMAAVIPIAFVCWLLLPLRCFNSLEGEKQDAQLDLMLCAGITKLRMVVGKVVSQAFLTALLVISVVPYFLAEVFFGQWEMRTLLATVGGIFLISIAASSIVIGLSGMVSRLGRMAVIAATFFHFWWIAGLSVFVFGFASWQKIIIYLNALLMIAFFIASGIQLGRSYLGDGRAFPMAQNQRYNLIMLLVGPLGVLFVSAITCGLGTLVGSGVILWYVCTGTRGPRIILPSPGIHNRLGTRVPNTPARKPSL